VPHNIQRLYIQTHKVNTRRYSTSTSQSLLRPEDKAIQWVSGHTIYSTSIIIQSHTVIATRVLTAHRPQVKLYRHYLAVVSTSSQTYREPITNLTTINNNTRLLRHYQASRPVVYQARPSGRSTIGRGHARMHATCMNTCPQCQGFPNFNANMSW